MLNSFFFFSVKERLHHMERIASYFEQSFDHHQRWAVHKSHENHRPQQIRKNLLSPVFEFIWRERKCGKWSWCRFFLFWTVNLDSSVNNIFWPRFNKFLYWAFEPHNKDHKINYFTISLFLAIFRKVILGWKGHIYHIMLSQSRFSTNQRYVFLLGDVKEKLSGGYF